MGRAVGIDQDGVGDVLHDGGAGERLGGPAGDGFEERGGRVLRAAGGDGEGLLGKSQRVYSAAGSEVGLSALIQSMAAKTTR